MTKIQKNHVKIGDKIKVISGKNKGTIGTIMLIQSKSIVHIDTIKSRLKVVKDKAKKQAIQIEIQTPIHISNVMLWDNSNNLMSRIGYKRIDEKKIRYFKKSGNLVEKK